MKVPMRLREIATNPVLEIDTLRLRLIGATVCRARGHRQDRVSILLGICCRCYGDVPNEQSQALWAALSERDLMDLPISRTQATFPASSCSTCGGGGCPDCTDPS